MGKQRKNQRSSSVFLLIAMIGRLFRIWEDYAKKCQRMSLPFVKDVVGIREIDAIMSVVW